MQGVNNKKLHPQEAPGPGIEPRLHWWDASALTPAKPDRHSIKSELFFEKFIFGTSSQWASRLRLGSHTRIAKPCG